MVPSLLQPQRVWWQEHRPIYQPRRTAWRDQGNVHFLQQETGWKRSMPGWHPQGNGGEVQYRIQHGSWEAVVCGSLEGPEIYLNTNRASLKLFLHLLDEICTKSLGWDGISTSSSVWNTLVLPLSKLSPLWRNGLQSPRYHQVGAFSSRMPIQPINKKDLTSPPAFYSTIVTTCHDYSIKG